MFALRTDASYQRSCHGFRRPQMRPGLAGPSLEPGILEREEKPTRILFFLWISMSLTFPGILPPSNELGPHKPASALGSNKSAIIRSAEMPLRFRNAAKIDAIQIVVGRSDSIRNISLWGIAAARSIA